MTFTRALLRVRLLYFSLGCIFLHAALSFFSVWFCSLRFGSSNEFVFLKDCFVGSCEHSASAVFAASLLFSFALCLPI